MASHRAVHRCQLDAILTSLHEKQSNSSWLRVAAEESFTAILPFARTSKYAAHRLLVILRDVASGTGLRVETALIRESDISTWFYNWLI
jgi:hypothetical protein